MADPIIPGGFRAQVVLQPAGALPADRFVNTFAFKEKTVGGANLEEAANEIQTRLTQFYAAATTSALRVGQYIPTPLRTGATVRVYALGDAPPRLAAVRTIDFTGVPAASNTFPRELAICMSFYSHRNLPRRRGRIYIGPLVIEAALTASNGHLVSTAAVTAINESALRLASEGVGDKLDWSILSPTAQELYPVTGGWVDNDFDIQRRRGIVATTRAGWTGPGHDPGSI